MLGGAGLTGSKEVPVIPREGRILESGQDDKYMNLNSYLSGSTQDQLSYNKKKGRFEPVKEGLRKTNSKRLFGKMQSRVSSKDKLALLP